MLIQTALVGTPAGLVCFHNCCKVCLLILLQHGHPETDKRSLQKFVKENFTELSFLVSFSPNSFAHINAVTVFSLPVLVELSFDTSIYFLLSAWAQCSAAAESKSGSLLSVKNAPSEQCEETKVIG